MKNNNVFTTFIKILNVKYTHGYSSKCFNEHPHKYDLYGISKMLSDYGIENVGLKVSNKEDLLQIETPFIAHISIDFVVVYKITEEQVFYIWEGKKISISIKQFFEVWTGIVLIAEPDENSIEPDFVQNKKKEYLDKFQKIILYVGIGMLLISSLLIFNLYKNIGALLLLIINLAGIYISYLLVLKQLKIQSSHGDKICSLFKESDCNNILDSKVARIGDFIGWSEIGLGYFCSNSLIVLFFSSYLPFLAIINICALPYTFWSVWYQKVKVNQWCPLCLIVQAILWIIFFINLSFGFIALPPIGLDYVFVGSIYLVPIILINLMVPQLGLGGKIENITQELKSIKLKKEVFNALIQSQPHYEIGKSTSTILFGNIYSKNRITIVTNPHCEPCAKLHEKMVRLLGGFKDTFCIQYIFVSFEGQEDSSKYLIAVYQNYDLVDSEKIFTKWFNKGGKYDRNTFSKNYPVDVDTNVEAEFSAHKQWQENTKINSTPTIFINGFQLSRLYQLEEIAELDFSD